MDYLELHLSITPNSEENRDILVAQLADLDYDSFTDADDGTFAYKKTSSKQSVDEDIAQIVIPEGVKISHSTKIIKDQDWNVLWESNFEPIVVDNNCMIRASFHEPIPNIKFDIVIDPKMSFGTGHHQTTHLMIKEVLKADIAGKNVLDMGCGTAVLAILAEMRGAQSIVAIDNDEWAYNNSVENIRKNACTKISAKHGDASLLTNCSFDIILANINLNILYADMPKYINCLNHNGILFTSGILVTDIEKLVEFGQSLNLKHVETQTLDNWAMVKFALQ